MMDIKKRLDDELKKVVEDKTEIRERFERRVAERRIWAAPVVDAARALEQETAARADMVWEIEEMSAGVRLGKPGHRRYRRLEITVMPPAPDRERAIFVMRQTDAGGNELAQTSYQSADDAINALIKAVGEHVANTKSDSDADSEGAGPSVPGVGTNRPEGPAIRGLTVVLAVLLGILALFAGWFAVAELPAVPDDITASGVRTVGSLWERLVRLLD